MLNKYAVAVSSKETPWIETVSATSIKDAEDKGILNENSTIIEYKIYRTVRSF